MVMLPDFQSILGLAPFNHGSPKMMGHRPRSVTWKVMSDGKSSATRHDSCTSLLMMTWVLPSASKRVSVSGFEVRGREWRVTKRESMKLVVAPESIMTSCTGKEGRDRKQRDVDR